MKGLRVIAVTLLISTVAAHANGVRAQDDAQPATAAEVARLQRELDETRRLLKDYNASMVDTQEEVVRLNGLLLQNGALPFTSSVVPSSAFLPPPADPTNLFFNEANAADVNLGAGSRVLGTELIFRAALSGNAQMWYDTGLVGSGASFDPATIAIGGSSAQGAGFFDLVDFNGEFKFDLNVPISDEEQAQAFLETIYFDNELLIRHAFGRVTLAKVNVLAGSYWTTWGDEGTIPKSISVNGFPAGANVAPTVPQLRFAFPSSSGWVTTVAVQQPMGGIIALRGAPDDDVVLQRYPDIAARLRYFDGDFFSVSFGAIMHVMGRENVALNEDFTTGWGVAGATRFRTGDCGALMLGAVGGRGIAGSIFGLASDSLAAGTSADGELVGLGNYGGYAGYQHQWADNLISTLAYGFAQGERTAANPEKTRRVQNGWANVIYKANPNFAFGVQYDYGSRDLVDHASGDDHRVMLVVSVISGQNDKSSGDTAVATMAPSAGDSLRDEIRRSIPTDSGVSRFPRM